MLVGAVLAAAACTKEQNKCTSDSDCKDVAYPFCDVNGEFAASGGAKDVCTIVPPNCPVERCGCSPGAARCDADMLITCDPGGTSESTQTCADGCGGSDAHCLAFEPLNGLGVALASAETGADITIPNGSTIDTASGAVTTSGNLPVDVPSVVIDQGGRKIRAFFGRSISVGDVHVVGDASFALVSATTMSIVGTLDASGASVEAGPGALGPPQLCAGGASMVGGGGGGNATAGGRGGVSGVASMTESTLETLGLVGGCKGGDFLDNSGNVTAIGGGGGGAVQLVAGASITLASAALINVGAGGGASAAGGGSGGNVVIEAPIVTFGSGARIVANGGGGGACNSSGGDATTDTTAAAGAGPCGTQPVTYRGGSGGTVAAAPTSGVTVGGGGGSVGQLLTRTRNGQVMDSGATISAASTIETLPAGQ